MFQNLKLISLSGSTTIIKGGLTKTGLNVLIGASTLTLASTISTQLSFDPQSYSPSQSHTKASEKMSLQVSGYNNPIMDRGSSILTLEGSNINLDLRVEAPTSLKASTFKAESKALYQAPSSPKAIQIETPLENTTSTQPITSDLPYLSEDKIEISQKPSQVSTDQIGTHALETSEAIEFSQTATTHGFQTAVTSHIFSLEKLEAKPAEIATEIVKDQDHYIQLAHPAFYKAILKYTDPTFLNERFFKRRGTPPNWPMGGGPTDPSDLNNFDTDESTRIKLPQNWFADENNDLREQFFFKVLKAIDWREVGTSLMAPPCKGHVLPKKKVIKEFSSGRTYTYYEDRNYEHNLPSLNGHALDWAYEQALKAGIVRGNDHGYEEWIH